MQRSTINLVTFAIVCSLWLLAKCDAQPKNEVDCSQFVNDEDILRQLPFPLVDHSYEFSQNHSKVEMYENTSDVRGISIYKEKVVPSSIYCLSKLEKLEVYQTPFENDIVPDALGNLENLAQLIIFDVKIAKLTEKLATLRNMIMLTLIQCSLIYVPNLSNLQQLESLSLDKNNLSHVDGITGVTDLMLENNQFKQIPMTQDPDRLMVLAMGDNPLTSAAPIMSYKNLEWIFLNNATITSIPATIDKLRNVEYLRLSNNKLTRLPTNILNLRRLKELTIENNLIAKRDVESIRQSFKRSHPKLKLLS
ncbi:hypothetical protein I4U23_001479 [Adineta vaga]|nr:hypothetical protein I4U23_001479 [Adineta vaga]